MKARRARQRRPRNGQPPSSRHAIVEGRLAALRGRGRRSGADAAKQLRTLEAALQQHYEPKGDTTAEIQAIQAEVARRTAKQQATASQERPLAESTSTRPLLTRRTAIQISTSLMFALAGALAAFISVVSSSLGADTAVTITLVAATSSVAAAGAFTARAAARTVMQMHAEVTRFQVVRTALRQFTQYRDRV
ncbi:hypothetical protein [Streptomyces sp. NEAU-174]|uniref:hypothetical protein n=1 Tax=Streptomyces sp. NEAU-174 TaxID=3458254 RepID=UPI0040443490